MSCLASINFSETICRKLSIKQYNILMFFQCLISSACKFSMKLGSNMCIFYGITRFKVFFSDYSSLVLQYLANGTMKRTMDDVPSKTFVFMQYLITNYKKLLTIEKKESSLIYKSKMNNQKWRLKVRKGILHN